MNPEASPTESTWTPAARLLRPQGRRGELLADRLTDLPGLFTAGRRVSIASSRAAPNIETTIESCWSPTGRNAGRVVLKLAGSDSISEAELLAGRDLLVLSSDLPALEPDTWFVRDLIGCRLFDQDTFVGEIIGVEFPMSADGRTRLADAHTLLEVTPLETSQSNQAPAGSAPSAAPESALIPFVKAWIVSVNLAEKRIVMRLPPGLVDLDKSDPPPVNSSE